MTKRTANTLPEPAARKPPTKELFLLKRRLGLCQAAALNVVNAIGPDASIVIVSLLAVMLEPQVLMAGGATAMLVFCHWIGTSDD